MLRVIFMGTPEFSVPALDAINQLHSIVGVYTQPDKPVGRGLDHKSSPVKLKALNLGLPVFQPERLSQPGELEKLKALKPDVMVVVAYGQILKRDVLDVPRLGCVNIHSSLLPRWRGAAPIQWAILEGDPETGITTMRMVEKLDAGAILLQKKTPIAQDDTAPSLHDRLSQMGAELITLTLEGLEKQTLIDQAQDEAQVTYASKLSKEMEKLDLSLSAETLDRKIRALTPWPGSSLQIMEGPLKGRLKIKQAHLRKNIKGRTGQIFEQSGMLLLGTPDGCLELRRLQWDGKKESTPNEFLNGLKGRGQALPLQVG